MPPSDRVAAVWAALEPVNDPELDESVVALGFVSSVEVEDCLVRVGFRLPTFWCSANFAFIMAEDMRDALAGLPWVKRAEIRLLDHFAAEKINHGIAARRGFSDVFGSDAADDLRAVRDAFRRRAYLGRMSALIDALRESGRSNAAILALSVGELVWMGRDQVFAQPVARFIERRAEFGGPAQATDDAFRKPDGAEISADGLRDYLREIRMARRGAEANGEMCRMLLKARQEFPTPPETASFGSSA